MVFYAMRDINYTYIIIDIVDNHLHHSNKGVFDAEICCQGYKYHLLICTFPMRLFRFMMFLSSIYLAKPSIISTDTAGFKKFAVPTATADAPARKNSTASCAVVIPPMPIIGILTALYTCHTIRTATGLIAGPDNPPVILANLGLHVSVSITIPRSVLINDIAFAPSSSHTFAKGVMSVTLGDNLIITGRDVDLRILRTTCRVALMSVPKAIPPSLMFGQDMFAS